MVAGGSTPIPVTIVLELSRCLDRPAEQVRALLVVVHVTAQEWS